MRVIRSLIGSCVLMLRSSLPARLHEAGNQALEPEFTHRDTAELGLAVNRARTARHLATVADARRRRIARHLRELQRGREALLERLLLVIDDRLQPRALGSRLLRHPCAPIVLLDRTFLRHA